jgi:hypothetical protein
VLLLAMPSWGIGDDRWPVIDGGGLLPGGATGGFCNAVANSCAGVATPCFSGDTSIQDCIDDVESSAPTSEFRTVYVYPGLYTDDVDCTPADGHTAIVGLQGRTPRAAAGSGSGPQINGQSGSAGTSLTLGIGNCSAYRLKIQQGPDQNVGSCGTPACSDTAVAVVAGELNGQTQVSDLTIESDPTDGLGIARLVSLEGNGASSVIFLDSVVYTCFCSITLVGAVPCASTSACTWVDTDGRVEINGSDIGLGNIGAADDLAMMEIVDGDVRVSTTNVFCEAGAGEHEVNCVEIDDNDVILDLSNVFFFGGLLSSVDHGRFMEVVGTGTSSQVNFATAVGGSGGFPNFDSNWGTGPVVPNWFAGCNESISTVFDPDEANTPHYVGIGSSTTYTVEPVLDTTVNVFRISQEFLPTDLGAEINVAPGAGESWTFTLRDDGASTLATCTISGGSSTSCIDTTPRRASVIGAGSLINLEVTHTGPTGLTAAGEAVVSFCLNPVPR